MTFKPVSALSMAGIAAAAIALPSAANAQVDLDTLPPEYRTGPAVADYSETTVDADGVETITRTRRIESRMPYQGEYADHAAHDQYYVERHAQPHHGYANYAHTGYAPAASVFSREDWIAECENRTSGRGDREKGGIIGGLLGAIAGGIIGNRVSDGERLGGTLIGIGTGGIAGVLLGSLIGGGRNDRGDYDCEAALDSYLSQYGYPGAAPVTRVAARTIPAPVYAAPPPPPAYSYGYNYGSYAYAPSYSYSYAPPQQVVYVPVRYEQRQRVIVRETVREEVIPGATRTIPRPAPAPTPLPQPVPQPEPQPVPQAEPRYIKGY